MKPIKRYKNQYICQKISRQQRKSRHLELAISESNYLPRESSPEVTYPIFHDLKQRLPSDYIVSRLSR